MFDKCLDIIYLHDKHTFGSVYLLITDSFLSPTTHGKLMYGWLLNNKWDNKVVVV